MKKMTSIEVYVDHFIRQEEWNSGLVHDYKRRNGQEPTRGRLVRVLASDTGRLHGITLLLALIASHLFLQSSTSSLLFLDSS